MKFLEKDLEGIIYDNLVTKEGQTELLYRGLNTESVGDYYLAKRQQYIGNYGTADIVTLSRGCSEDGTVFVDENITVFELKKDIVNLDTLIQASRYAKGIKAYYQEKYEREIVVNIVLIGKKVDTNSDFIYLFELIRNVQVYKYDYKMDGLFFTEINLVDFDLIEKGF